ncbi:hypothetical protein D0868_04332 [Hortaea werneckii]|uniref:Ubiquitin-like protease family profile domain-containing protein n=1 Tax=Hortaea werneckii TaxID=91943 RepID=A0A3M6Z2M8_HORWE|nr:hypothetical protein D0868_04332 [Hortaea werneckii]
MIHSLKIRQALERQRRLKKSKDEKDKTENGKPKQERKRKAPDEDETRERDALAKSADKDGEVKGANEQEVGQSAHGHQECETKCKDSAEHQRDEHDVAAASADEGGEASGTDKPKETPQTKQDQGQSPVPDQDWINKHRRKYVARGGYQPGGGFLPSPSFAEIARQLSTQDPYELERLRSFRPSSPGQPMKPRMAVAHFRFFKPYAARTEEANLEDLVKELSEELEEAEAVQLVSDGTGITRRILEQETRLLGVQRQYVNELVGRDGIEGYRDEIGRARQDMERREDRIHLSPAWTAAVDRFFALDQGSIDALPSQITRQSAFTNSLSEVLKEAQKVLRAGRQINDEVINYYIALLQVTADEEGLNIAFAPSFFYANVKEFRPNPESTCKRVSATSFRSFERIVLPVWTDKPAHWSVIIIEPAKHVISHFDPLQGTAGAEPLQDIGGLIRGWIGGVKQWKSEKWQQVQEQRVLQQQDSNDCGPISLCIIRLALAEDARPADVADASVNNVGAVFRRRIMAELIANKVNPQDADIPQTLRPK